jgi:hypothetical protein
MREQPVSPVRLEWMPAIPKVLPILERPQAAGGSTSAEAPPREVLNVATVSPAAKVEPAASIRMEPADERIGSTRDSTATAPAPLPIRAADPVVSHTMPFSVSHPQTKIHIGQVEVMVNNTAPRPAQSVPRPATTATESPASPALNRFRLRL